jgi:glycosyltransferase involved in cell wall biosynthesis
MTANIIIAEDSSKFHFGGGQKISLEVAALLHGKYRLSLFDCRKGTLFQERMRPFVDEMFPLACFGKFKQSSSRTSFNIGLGELLLAVPLLIYNLVRVILYLRTRMLTKDNTILYAASKKPLMLAYMIRKTLGIEYLFHAHTIDDRSSLLYRLLELPLKSARRIICVSKTVQENIDLPQCRLVYNPVQIQAENRPRSIKGKQRIVVASFSSLIDLKGIDFFMQSHRHLRSKEKVVYWVFGDGPEKDRLRHYESEQVILKGFTDKVGEILAGSVDILAAPSLVEESFGLIIAEALANGIPVVTTDHGAQAELVRDGLEGYQVPVRDARAIAERIDRLVEHPETYDGFSRNARERAASFDPAVFERTMLSLLAPGEKRPVPGPSSANGKDGREEQEP